MMSRRRLPTPAGPAEIARLDGLAYTLWLPEGEPEGSLLMIHGAGSQKENQHDIARAARSSGYAAICFDQRGHGESEGSLDLRALDDVAAMASLLPRPLALRGTSMGGCIALAAAQRVTADAVVAVCAASPELLLRGLRSGALNLRSDPAVEGLLATIDLGAIVGRSRIPTLFMHAEGDERVPVAHSVDLHARCGAELKKLIVAPGGHHRSVQHDVEMTGEMLRFVRKAFRTATAR